MDKLKKIEIHLLSEAANYKQKIHQLALKISKEKDNVDELVKIANDFKSYCEKYKEVNDKYEFLKSHENEVKEILDVFEDFSVKDLRSQLLTAFDIPEDYFIMYSSWEK